jgi:hypothetical protein
MESGQYAIYCPSTNCFFADIETNECLNNNGGCWQDKAANVTACKVFLLSQHLWMCFCGRMLNFSFCLSSLFPLLLFDSLYSFRILFGEEYVNALLCKV